MKSTHVIRLVCARSNRPIQHEPLGISHSDPDLAKQEADIAALSKTFELGRRIRARIEERRV